MTGTGLDGENGGAAAGNDGRGRMPEPLRRDLAFILADDELASAGRARGISRSTAAKASISFSLLIAFSAYTVTLMSRQADPAREGRVVEEVQNPGKTTSTGIAAAGRDQVAEAVAPMADMRGSGESELPETVRSARTAQEVAEVEVDTTGPITSSVAVGSESDAEADRAVDPPARQAMAAAPAPLVVAMASPAPAPLNASSARSPTMGADSGNRRVAPQPPRQMASNSVPVAAAATPAERRDSIDALLDLRRQW